jgi:hypothetical protein
MQNAEITQHAGDTLKKVTAAARERARGEGERLIGEARNEAQGFAVERRDVAASYVVDIADALDSATRVLDERGRSTSAHYVRRAADELHHFSERVNRQDVGRWIGEIEAFARAQPLLFFGGAFLIGYAAIRLLGVNVGDGDFEPVHETEGLEAMSTEGTPPPPPGTET